MFASSILALMRKLTKLSNKGMIDSSLALFISSRIHLPLGGGMHHDRSLPNRLKAHHFVEISKQTKKCISPFGITVHYH
ncbi:hypothetical protein ACNKHN_11735 [Shigella flexneri]